MKKLIIALLLLPAFLMAQKDVNYVGGDHGKLVEIIGYNANSVLNYVGNYMNDDFNFTEQASGKKEMPYHISMNYKPKISNSVNRAMSIKYVVDNNGLITNCSIGGDYLDVINFFIQYWPTTMSFDDVVKQQTAVKYLVTDKIILTLNAASKTAKIDLYKNN